jgi:hypothetical protein
MESPVTGHRIITRTVLPPIWSSHSVHQSRALQLRCRSQPRAVSRQRMKHVAFRVGLVANAPFVTKTDVKPAVGRLGELPHKTRSIGGVQYHVGIMRITRLATGLECRLVAKDHTWERHAGTSRVGDTRLGPAHHPKRYAPQTTGLHELGFQPKSPDFDLQRHNLARQFSSPPAAQRSELQPDFLEAMREQAVSRKSGPAANISRGFRPRCRRQSS